MSQATDTHLLDDALWACTLNFDVASTLAGQTLQFFYGDATGSTQQAPLLVTSVNEQVIEEKIQQYSLHFKGPSTPLLPQQTYRARHSEFGDFAIFITAVAREHDGIVYEACFNHAR